jgi:hypothetical protein
MQRLVEPNAREDARGIPIDRIFRNVAMPRAVIRQEPKAFQVGIQAEVDCGGLAGSGANLEFRAHILRVRVRQQYGAGGQRHHQAECILHGRHTACRLGQ